MLMASPPPPSRRPPAASGSVTSLGDDQLAPAPAAVPRQPRTKRGHRSRSPVQQRRRYSASSTVSSGTLGSDASTTCAEDREVGTITTTSSAGASASSASSSTAAAAAASPATEMRASSGVRSVVSRLLDKAAKLRSMPARPEVKVTPAHDQFEELVAEAQAVRQARPRGSVSMVGVAAQFDPSAFHFGVKENKHGPLYMIFNFYAKLMPPHQQLGKPIVCTFDEIKLANETLCFGELLGFARDFELVPQLITKGDLMYVWESQRGGPRGFYEKNCIDLVQFKECLARIALMVYAQPPRSRTPRPPAEKVQGLIRYLHLDDITHVRHVINTKGRKSMQALHMPGVDVPIVEGRDMNGKLQERATDVKRRAARLKATRRLSQENIAWRRSMSRATEKAVWSGDGRLHISRLGDDSGLSEAELAKLLPPSGYYAYARRPPPSPIAANGGGGAAASVNSRGSSGSSSTLGASVAGFSAGGVSVTLGPAGKTKGRKKSKAKGASTSPKHFLRKRDMTMYEAREDADGFNLVAMRAQAMREFSPSLPFAFTPFQTDHSYTSWQSFDAPAIDTGRILVGSSYKFRLTIVNSCADTVHVTASKTNIPGMELHYVPKPLPPGLRTVVSLVAAPLVPLEAVGSITVRCRNSNNTRSESHTIPVYIRAVPAGGPAAAFAEEPPLSASRLHTGHKALAHHPSQVAISPSLAPAGAGNTHPFFRRFSGAAISARARARSAATSQRRHQPLPQPHRKLQSEAGGRGGAAGGTRLHSPPSFRRRRPASAYAATRDRRGAEVAAKRRHPKGSPPVEHPMGPAPPPGSEGGAAVAAAAAAAAAGVAHSRSSPHTSPPPPAALVESTEGAAGVEVVRPRRPKRISGASAASGITVSSQLHVSCSVVTLSEIDR